MIATSTISFGSDEEPHFFIAGTERFSDDSGWRGSLTMRSGAFALIGHAFYFDDIEPFFKDIQRIYSSLKGTAILRPRYEHDRIEIIASTRGHIIAKGHFEAYSPEVHRLDLEFTLDQTFLPPLIASVGRVIQETK